MYMTPCPYCWGTKIVPGPAVPDVDRALQPCSRCGGSGEVEDVLLSEHFSSSEWWGKPHYPSPGLSAVPNLPNLAHFQAGQLTCLSLLEKLRVESGPLHANSGYRVAELDVIADHNNPKWLTQLSAHQTGSALDILAYDPKVTVLDLMRFFLRNKDKLKWDQIIPEGSCLHVAAEAPYADAHGNKQRQQILVRVLSPAWKLWSALKSPGASEPVKYDYEAFNDTLEQITRIV